MGGGFVAGSATLIGGDPGIGKSTLLLQAAGRLAKSGKSVVYISGEEAAAQVRLRAQRLGLGDAAVELASATSVRDNLATLAGRAAAFVVIASIPPKIGNTSCRERVCQYDEILVVDGSFKRKTKKTK